MDVVDILSDLVIVNCEFCKRDLSKLKGNLYVYINGKRNRICFKCLHELMEISLTEIIEE